MRTLGDLTVGGQGPQHSMHSTVLPANSNSWFIINMLLPYEHALQHASLELNKHFTVFADHEITHILIYLLY